MAWELRHIRTLVAIAEAGSFTDAAIALGISQAQVSRTLGALEQHWDVRLVRRGPREAALTAQGQQAVRRGRHLLALAEQMEAETRGQQRLRLGYAWAAVGRHTRAMQRSWVERQPGVALTLIRGTGPLAGLSEGLVDAAIVRTPPPQGRFDSALVGLERRVASFPAEDPWASRRRLRMADFTDRAVLVDSQSGTTSPALWPAEQRPDTAAEVDSVDAWLDAITAGVGIGVSSEATAHQHQRAGVLYRVISDAPPVQVRLVWHRGEHSQTIAALQRLLTELYAESDQH
ncbi:LysR family transcriptional regulator [Nesterenkonia jeotgali]|uniref:HTH lysR-type domain-containing protein n=1 Tax=Nesterenkonia jeotgali TaxID=317018 RepID=A0A0W8IDQ4_9MICC|nr:LysR family transcriptional regulator [Nesterenkonia jeotgali]KUG58089.1 hypothetical protein AVL63_06310 [Nesterenkonia jeotgali]